VESGQTYDLNFDPSQYFLSETFSAAPDPTSGTDITLVAMPITAASTVSAGQTVDGVVIGSGGSVDVQSGGTASDATVKPVDPVVRSDEQWIMAVKLYRDAGAWSADGPSPDCYGCQAPADVLEMYGYGRKR
jgi:autotransporter passenger strand-loop-strand repeat protein